MSRTTRLARSLVRIANKEKWNLTNYISKTPRESTGWSCVTPRGNYRNLFGSPLACKYGCPGNNCRTVKVESDPEGDYWAYWDSKRERFFFIEKETYALELAFPAGAHKNVELGLGEIHKVTITEVEFNESH